MANQTTKPYKLPGEYVYDGMVFHSLVHAEVLGRIKDFEFQKEDVLVATYPKAGTTWIQEIVWLVVNDANVDEASRTHKDKRIPFIEIHHPGSEKPAIDMASDIPAPRVIKTHLPPRYFQERRESTGFKTVVVMRNLKDTLTSYYHFYKAHKDFGFKGTWDEYFELFKRKHLAHGDWFEVNLDWWKLRDEKTVLILKYEDVKRDAKAAVEKVAEFLGKKLNEQDVMKIVEHTSFDNMRQNSGTAGMKRGNDKGHPGDNIFYRKGIVGDWVSTFSKEQASVVDELVKATTEPAGLVFSDS